MLLLCLLRNSVVHLKSISFGMNTNESGITDSFFSLFFVVVVVCLFVLVLLVCNNNRKKTVLYRVVCSEKKKVFVLLCLFEFVHLRTRKNTIHNHLSVLARFYIFNDGTRDKEILWLCLVCRVYSVMFQMSDSFDFGTFLLFNRFNSECHLFFFRFLPYQSFLQFVVFYQFCRKYLIFISIALFELFVRL